MSDARVENRATRGRGAFLGVGAAAVAVALIVFLASRRTESTDDGPVPSDDAALRMPWAKTDDPFRDIHPSTTLILKHLSVRPGMVVADIGAGAGYFAFKLERVVGPTGMVHALDVDPAMVAHMRFEKQQRNADRITVKRVSASSPGLADESVDRILMVDALGFPTCEEAANSDYLDRCHRALRPGGILVIFRAGVHTEEWAPPYGKPLPCSEMAASEIAKLQSDRLKVVTELQVPVANPALGVGPGFLLVLGRAD